MMGWCPNDGQECHHDGYCKDCPHEEGTVNGMKMKRIKGKYVAQVVLEWDLPRENNNLPLEKIRHNIRNGNMKNAIIRALYDGVCDCTVTVDQLFADVYEVDDEGGQE